MEITLCAGYSAADLVRLDIVVAGDAVDAFACVVERAEARAVGQVRGTRQARIWWTCVLV
jgi:translation elongation factor EF-4